MRTFLTSCSILAGATLAVFAVAPNAAAQITPIGGSQSISRPVAHIAPPAAVAIQRIAIESEKHASGGVLATSAPTEAYSHGNPTAEEQYLLELINRARANPTAEGEMLASVTDPAILSAYAYFNVDKNALKPAFAAYPVRPPLAFNSKLITAARLHSQDMSTNNFQGHNGSNGSTFDQRINAQGYVNWTGAGENVSAYSQSLLYSHCGFNVDWGNPDLGHRKNIMNFADQLFTEVGIGVIHDDHGAPHTGPLIVTHDFGNATKSIIVGVVYNDANGNKFYDVGEGISGVTIMPSTGQYYAVTSASGGYAIPVTQKGQMTLTASGGTFGTPAVKTITVGPDNVKVDFNPGSGGGGGNPPAAVTLVSPAAGASVATTPVRLSWNRAAGATLYHVQVATDTTFATIIAQDSLVADSTWLFASAVNGVNYRWRVRARNDAGWGTYSARRSFSVALPPVQVTLSEPPSSSTINAGNVAFRWRRGAASETRYWIEIATDPLFTTVTHRDSTLTDTLYMATGLAGSTTYYWHVRAMNAAGWGPFSGLWNATTNTSGVERTDAAGSAHILGAIPNPTANGTTIEIRLNRTASIALDIVDGMGNVVASPARGTYTAGDHAITWDATGLPSGLYFGRLATGTAVETIRLVVAR